MGAVLAAGAHCCGACIAVFVCCYQIGASVARYTLVFAAQEVRPIGAGEVAPHVCPVKWTTDGSVGAGGARWVADLVGAVGGVLAGGAGCWARALQALVEGLAVVQVGRAFIVACSIFP